MSFSSKSSNAPHSQPMKRTIPNYWPKVTIYGDLNMRPFRNGWMLEEIGLPYTHRMCKPWSRVAKSVHPLGKVPALLVECANDDGGCEDGTAGEKFVVLESAAINTFLGDLAREMSSSSVDFKQKRNVADPLPHNSIPTLVPPPATPQRAKYDSLAMFIMTELDAQSLWIHRKHSDLSNVFGDAPTAVREARRQFDNALDAMVAEIPGDENDSSNDNDEYLLPIGFSAVDILLANCCFWAQQIGWLEIRVKNPNAVTITSTSEKQTEGDNNETKAPKPLAPKLAAYLTRCRSRPAFVRVNELRKNQAHEKKETRISKL
ncbi:hypothetical protein ACHAXR_006682 [Thalassiosira sp. AJA248-18]